MRRHAGWAACCEQIPPPCHAQHPIEPCVRQAAIEVAYQESGRASQAAQPLQALQHQICVAVQVASAASIAVHIQEVHGAALAEMQNHVLVPARVTPGEALHGLAAGSAATRRMSSC